MLQSCGSGGPDCRHEGPGLHWSLALESTGAPTSTGHIPQVHINTHHSNTQNKTHSSSRTEDVSVMVKSDKTFGCQPKHLTERKHCLTRSANTDSARITALSLMTYLYEELVKLTIFSKSNNHLPFNLLKVISLRTYEKDSAESWNRIIASCLISISSR